ncbi:DUF5658 family protein [Methanolobus sediminis]|uniref:DUF5658 family protein n=1 Tax=Methanolobus sediminis TaxID=3072978 RepID=A0AA51UJQ8_9EURY|nr:DUF5658 family protein [Methanolobus sediminis]WMW24363.1 DUF5658 family protein [Methanolobus sediminis]
MSFLRDMLPVFLFFIVLDTLTTIASLPIGYEGNPIISWGLANFGYGFLIALKLVSILLFYICYVSVKQYRFAWNVSRYGASVIGLIASVSNMWVFFYGQNLFQAAGVL